MVGMVPELLSETGGWPIACHHCHQHYFAPVLSGPLPMARLIELDCLKCSFVSQIDIKALYELQSQNFSLYCPKCHNALIIPRNEEANETVLDEPASDTAEESAETQSVESPKQTKPKDTPRQAEPKKPSKKFSSGGVLLLLLIGFVISIILIDLAQQGIIDRIWLDIILNVLPDKSQLETLLKEIIAKVVQ
jgi:hypothetical protein